MGEVDRLSLIERDQGWTISVCWYCGRAEHAAVDPCDCAFDAAPRRMLSVAVQPADTPGAVAALRESAETLHRVSAWWEHTERSLKDCPADSCVKARSFEDCQAEPCVKARAALGVSVERP